MTREFRIEEKADLCFGFYNLDQCQDLDVKPSDSGSVVCRATNPVSTEEFHGLLTVRHPPVIVPPQSGTHYTLPHQTVTLHCTVTGQPAPTWEWTRNGRSLTPTSTYASLTSQLVLPASNNFFGHYTCTARNRLGADNYTIELLRAWRPVPPSVQLCRPGAVTITLCLSPPGRSGGLKVTHYQLRMQPARGEPFLGPYTFPVQSSLKLSGLIPDTDYRFALSAVSPAGRSSNVYISVQTQQLARPSLSLLGVHSVTQDNKDVYQVSWRVDSTGGLPIRDYRLQIRPVAASAWQTFYRIGPAARSHYQISRLMPNANYELRLSARNAFGYSLPQQAIFFTNSGSTVDGGRSLDDPSQQLMSSRILRMSSSTGIYDGSGGVIISLCSLTIVLSFALSALSYSAV